MNRIFKQVGFVICTVLTSGCSNENATSNSKVQVVCTTGLIADAISNILPENYEITALMPAGVDPHTYKSTTKDLKALSNADIIVYNGIHFEANLVDAIEELGKQKLTLPLGELVDEKKLISTSDFGASHDPHFWHDIQLFKESIEAAGKKLASTYSQDSLTIAQNTLAYSEKLNKTWTSSDSLIQLIPETQRTLITAHDAFSYYGRLFNIQVKAVQGVSTATEAGLRDITLLTDFIVNNSIPAVFVENSVSDRAIKSIIEGVESKNQKLILGGTLYSDGLGDTQSGAETYIKMILKNTTTISEALR